MNGRGHHLMLEGAVRNENRHPQVVTRKSVNRTVNLQVDGVVVVMAVMIVIAMIAVMIVSAMTVSEMEVQVICRS